MASDTPLAIVVPVIPGDDADDGLCDFAVDITESVKKLGYMVCLQTVMLIPILGWQLFQIMRQPSAGEC